jgi:hypothetical protein
VALGILDGTSTPDPATLDHLMECLDLQTPLQFQELPLVQTPQPSTGSLSHFPPLPPNSPPPTHPPPIQIFPSTSFKLTTKSTTPLRPQIHRQILIPILLLLPTAPLLLMAEPQLLLQPVPPTPQSPNHDLPAPSVSDLNPPSPSQSFPSPLPGSLRHGKLDPANGAPCAAQPRH